MAKVTEIKITSNKDFVLSEFCKQIEMGLKTIGLTAEGYAKDNCPVDTSRLKNSIAYAVESTEVQIGTNVEYAPFVEFRDATHKTGQAHFLRDAAATHGDEYQAIMEAALKA